MARKTPSDCPETLLRSLYTVGTRVCHLRKCFGWDQNDLARSAGLSLHYIRDVEGNRLVEVWVLWRITEALKMPYHVIWAGPKQWAKASAIREAEVEWDAAAQKPRARQAVPGGDVWGE